jgi:hypothetical protein
MRIRIAIFVGVLAAGTAAVAIAQPGSPVPKRAASNARVARRDVRALLAKVAMPSGATVVGRDPAPDARFSSPGSEPGSSALVDVHEFVRVAGDPSDAIAWFDSHAPTGSTVDGTGSGGGPGYEFDSVSYAFAPVNNVLTSRGVVVEATEARGGGTAIRIDAQDVYFVPRPKWEQLPSGITAIDLTIQHEDRSTGRTSTSNQTVTDVAQVSKIVSMVDGLPPGQPWEFHCPADFGPNITLTFLQGSKKVASVFAEGSGCGAVTFSLGGRQGPPLSDGDEFVSRVEHLLGIS